MTSNNSIGMPYSIKYVSTEPLLSKGIINLIHQVLLTARSGRTLQFIFIQNALNTYRFCSSLFCCHAFHHKFCTIKSVFLFINKLIIILTKAKKFTKFHATTLSPTILNSSVTHEQAIYKNI